MSRRFLNILISHVTKPSHMIKYSNPGFLKPSAVNPLNFSCRFLTVDSTITKTSSVVPPISNKKPYNLHEIYAVKQELAKCFQLDDGDILAIVSKYPKVLKHCKVSTLHYLKELGLKREVFLLLPWISAIPPDEIDIRRDVIIKAYPDMKDINVCAVFLKFEKEKLKKFVFEWQLTDDPTKSKFHFLAEFFEVPLEEFTLQVEIKKFLLNTSLEKIRRILTELTAAGVSKSDIYRDLWILRHNHYTIKTRLGVVAEAGLKTVKPRLLRSDSDRLNSFVKRHAALDTILEGHETMTSFLCDRLKCQPSDVQDMMTRWPRVKTINPTKMKQMVDYLLAEGFSTNLILMKPRVLVHKLSSVQERVAELRSIGYHFGSLQILCTTPARYQKLVEGFKADRNSEMDIIQ